MFDKYSTWQRVFLARDLWNPLPNQHDTPEGDLYYVLFFSFLDSKEKSNIAITFTSMNFSSKLNPSDCKPTQTFSYCGWHIMKSYEVTKLKLPHTSYKT